MIFIVLDTGYGCGTNYSYENTTTKLDDVDEPIESVYLSSKPIIYYSAFYWEYYSVIAVDPLFKYLHWFLYNIPGNEPDLGEVIFSIFK